MLNFLLIAAAGIASGLALTFLARPLARADEGLSAADRAEQLGLHIASPTLWKGHRNGTLIQLVPERGGVLCIALIPAAVPASLRYTVRNASDGEKVGPLWRHPEVREAVDAARKLGAMGIQLEHSQIAARYDDTDLFGMSTTRIDVVCAVALAFATAYRAGWIGWARHVGLEVREEGALVLGERDGIAIEVRDIYSPKRSVTLLSARLLNGLPAATSISKPQRGRATDIGDIILDGQLQIDTSNLELVATRIKTDAVRAPLLEMVLTGGATVYEDRVQISAEGRLDPEQLEARVAAMIELVTALG